MLSLLPDIGSCLLEGYGVLPSAPTRLRYSNLQARIYYKCIII